MQCWQSEEATLCAVHAAMRFKVRLVSTDTLWPWVQSDCGSGAVVELNGANEACLGAAERNESYQACIAVRILQ